MYKIEIDTHTHTIASTHAFSTITEIATEVKKKGMKAVAITDHAPSVADSPHEWYFSNLKILPETINGVRIIKGVELSLVDEFGAVDLKDFYLKNLEWANLSVHYEISQEDGYNKITNGYLKALENPHINCISHMGSPRFCCDYEKVIKKAGELSKVIEINNNSKKVRQGSFLNCVEIAKLCKEYNVNIVVSSDAHFHEQIGIYDDAFEILKAADFPQELILNADLERFLAYLNKQKGM